MLARRRVQHYGFEFRYATRDVDPRAPSAPMPPCVLPLLDRMAALLQGSASSGPAAGVCEPAACGDAEEAAAPAEQPEARSSAAGGLASSPGTAKPQAGAVAASSSAALADRGQGSAGEPVRIHGGCGADSGGGGLSERGASEPALDQLTVNEYAPGVGLSRHLDTHSAFTGETACATPWTDWNLFGNPAAYLRPPI